MRLFAIVALAGFRAHKQVATKFIQMLDLFDNAFSAVTPKTDEEKEIAAAFKGTKEDMLKSFEDGLGVKTLETIGKEYDANFHEALYSMPDPEYEPGFICQQMQCGYVLGDILVRPAMVVVSE
mmetsp:Transcript_35611/g.35818  ORF Transcript_35611/g.35818 Transcript_35611/m.35818 type:complete len:123 (-) Transcript_35611:241-609(-)|eukprot:CAMPEP_0171311446 /NCGR_PEP_ID=MMETSP0816-20121228/21708_1 /TAXON_ID=420281 /ORGANISM="Proboscia inermis, Strain CCAP1064/1" /LENGTH=122 /DNA_ID=CAMNT_0011796237 /DNA_START=227 /DNA_END=595 /DNA_ORIENTATION=-